MRKVIFTALLSWVMLFILVVSAKASHYSTVDWIILSGVFLLPFVPFIIKIIRTIGEMRESPQEISNPTTELTLMQRDLNSIDASTWHNRSDQEEDLISNFFTEFQQTLTLAEDKLYALVNDIYNGSDLDERILRVRRVISHYEHFRSFCYSKGPGGQMYFQDMWEHCHNSQKPDFDYIDQFQDLLEKWTSQKETNDESALIRQKLLHIIKERPGILQKDIYAHFTPEYKGVIRGEMMQLEIDGVVRREEHGNTYALYLK